MVVAVGGVSAVEISAILYWLLWYSEKYPLAYLILFLFVVCSILSSDGFVADGLVLAIVVGVVLGAVVLLCWWFFLLLLILAFFSID